MKTRPDIFDMTHCVLCPRECGADRLHKEAGACGTDAKIHAALAYLHRWEEPCLTGKNGSGTVFFTGCSLGCIFCQNHEIAHRQGQTLSGAARDVALSPQALSDAFLSLQEKGAANINLVTAAHQLPAVLPALTLARKKGLTIPYVYNSSGYEKAPALRALEKIVDIYLPDMKFFSPELSRKYANAPDYFSVASAAIDEMVRQQPKTVFAEDEANAEGTAPAMLRGVIVRLLVLPGFADDAKRILSYLYSRYGNDICYSILNQYTPMPATASDPFLSRALTETEYDEVTDYAISLGIENGFVQEGETVSESFIPAFDGEGLTSPSAPCTPDI